MGRERNRRLGLVFAAVTALFCAPAALAKNEGKSDAQIAAEAAALEQQKKQHQGQDAEGAATTGCGISLLGVKYQGSKC